MHGFIKKNSDVGLLLARLALAFVFLTHGIAKLENLEGTVGFFTGRVGLPEPVAYLVTAVEALGGLAMLLGVFTEFAGVALAIEMVVTTFVLNLSRGLLAINLDFSMLLLALAVVFGGPGALAAERWFKKQA